MSADPFDAPSKVVRRSKDGRPYVHDLEAGKEKLYTRVTTFIDCLEDKTALGKWYERMVLLGVRDEVGIGRRLMATEPVPVLSDDPSAEEVLERNGLLDEEKKLLSGIAEDAKEAAGYKDAADLGTRLHELTEYADGPGIGHLPRNTPAVLERDVSAYLEALERYGLEPIDSEVFVVNDQLKAAGTFDRIYRWTRPDGSTLRVIGDLKTGRVDYGQGKLAQQLALYAHSRRYDPDRPTAREPLYVSEEVGLIVHLPVGRAECRVYAAPLELGWRGCLLADEVREWRRATKRILTDLALDADLLGRSEALDS